MKRNLVILALLTLLVCNCSKLHKKAYYTKVDSEEKSRYQEGYHSHEANRLIDYKNKKREAIEKKSEKKQEKIATKLNDANRNRKSGVKKKKKLRFDFYM